MNKKITKFLIIFLILAATFSRVSKMCWAQAPEEVQEQEAPTSSEATEAIRGRINRAVESTHAGSSNDKTRRGFVGRLERVSEDALTFETIKGTQIIPLEDDTRLIKNNQPVEISDVEIEDSAIILGHQNNNGFEPALIIFSDKDLFPRPKFVIIGSLLEIDANQLRLISRREEKEYSITTNVQTNYENIEGDNLGRTSLFKDMQVIAAGYIESDDNDSGARIANLVRSLVAL